ncbi:alpha/beta-hydrolase [Lojkania enalia]|uniref:carboxypeptidase C n=1 Tax=Lojkania enalia TaxID=147567 RepID=A0A9P4K1S1_9PLEO|nr:alpha/beta-hydrolase [Didymosphaeria enalia]
MVDAWYPGELPSLVKVPKGHWLADEEIQRHFRGEPEDTTSFFNEDKDSNQRLTIEEIYNQPDAVGKEECFESTYDGDNNTICTREVLNPINDPGNNFGTLLQFCGYITIHASTRRALTRLFFWIVMSDTNPPATDNNPVVMWLNGGPGVSSFFGLWDQWGPRLFDHSSDPLQFKNNAYHMMGHSNWVFLEQPAGVGYSFGRQQITDSMAAARDAAIFLDGIIKHTIFRRNDLSITLAGRELHIGGESFAGHWIPAIGAELVNTGRAASLNLRSVFIGNGAIDSDELGVFDLFCGTNPQIAVGVDITKLCEAMPTLDLNCRLANDICRHSKRAKVETNCNTADTTCYPTRGFAWARTLKLNPYDATKTDAENNAMFKFLKGPVQKFMNKGTTLTQFGVPATKTWSMFNSMPKAFKASGDHARSYVPELMTILNAEIDVMLYAGDKDLVCPWTGVKEVAKKLDWTENDPGLGMTKKKRFESSTSYANYIRAGRLNFVRVKGAGHMINENKPAEAQHLLEEWILRRDNFVECPVTTEQSEAISL